MIARVHGLPDYPFAVIGHPVANNGDDALRVKAEAAVRQIVPLLTQRGVC
ncbi:MAG TPA: hypothetical protein VKF40_00765 [Burkholderiales bacterium]|nr:hypothetical protein [Burkholderiales bacterium]